MYPFNPNRSWYEQYWYSQKAATLPWRVPAALATLAAIMIAAWIA